MLTRKGQAGFTMVELMLVIVILGILATIVVPRGLRQVQDNYALEGATRNLAQNLRLAREMAMAEGRSIRIVFNADSWQIVRLPYGPEDVVSTTELEAGVKIAEFLLTPAHPGIGGTLALPMGAVEFNCAGRLDQGGWIKLASRDGQQGLVEINTLGIIQVALSKD